MPTALASGTRNHAAVVVGKNHNRLVPQRGIERLFAGAIERIAIDQAIQRHQA
jgi:hypothetical protein